MEKLPLPEGQPEQEAPKPIMEWDSQESFSEQVVWWSRLDGRYQIEVRGDAADTHKGEMIIFNHIEQDKVVYQNPVVLSYGAMFGPDVADVELWKQTAVSVIDSLPADN